MRTGFGVVCPVAAVSKPRLRGQHLSLARCLPQHTWTPPLSPTGFTIQLVTSRHQHRAGTFINCDANWRKHTLLVMMPYPRAQNRLNITNPHFFKSLILMHLCIIGFKDHRYMRQQYLSSLTSWSRTVCHQKREKIHTWK